MSGDGGWARFDRGVARALVASGVPVVGWSAFRYLWRERTPEDIATDLAAVMHDYRAAWQTKHVLLIGFSRGADLMPFAYNRLPADPAEQVAAIGLLAPTAEAGFGYRLVDWLLPETLSKRWFGPPPGLRAITPEISRLPQGRTVILSGADDPMAIDSEALASTHVQAETWPGGHHLGHAYTAIAERLLALAGI